MFIAQIMTRRIVTVSMDDRLHQIREIFNHVRFHHLLVLDEHDKLVGVISDRDLLKHLSPYVDTAAAQERDLATLNKRAHQVMTRHPITVESTTTVVAAVRTLLDEDVSCLAVVDSGKHPVGVVTWKDLLRSFVDVINSEVRR